MRKLLVIAIIGLLAALALSAFAGPKYQSFRGRSCEWCQKSESLTVRMEWAHFILQSECKTNGHPEWINVQWNGATLCRKCHWTIQHGGENWSKPNRDVVQVFAAHGVWRDGWTNVLNYYLGGTEWRKRAGAWSPYVPVEMSPIPANVTPLPMPYYVMPSNIFYWTNSLIFTDCKLDHP